MSQATKQVIPDGYQQTGVGVIPDDWDVENISSIASKVTDGTHDTPRPVKEGVPFFTAIHIKENSIDYGSCYYLPQKIHDEIYKRCNPELGDVLMVNIGAGTATTALVTVNYPFSLKNVALIKPNDQKLDGRYLNQSLIFKRESVLETLSSGGAQPFLSLTQIGQIKVPVPQLQEQIAIANALSDVDALLSELEKLIAKKQAIKTATMQQLLTGKTRLPQFATYADGDKQGQIKGTKPSELGEIPEDWEVKALSSMLNATPSYGINAAAVPLVGNLPVYIRITDISEDGYFKPSKRVGVNSPLSDLYKLQIGDLVLARTGASVGKSYLYRESDGELVFAGFLIRVSPNEKKLISEYLSHYLKTDKYWAWVTVNSMRSGQPGINGNEFGSLPLPIPSTEEQTAIATILSDIDEEIQALKQRLSKTRQIKQGMMQELLTGKTRLPFDKTNMKLQGEPHAD